ncbi:unnamed protein product, partial [Prorocentrum cordatum]
RARRSEVLLQWADHGVDALNGMHGHSGAPLSAPANLGQQTSLNVLEDCYLGMGVMPSEPGLCEEALHELVSSSAVYSDDGGARAPYSKELVSWPEVGASPTDLLGCLTQDDNDWAPDWRLNLLQTPDEALQEARYANAYFHPAPPTRLPTAAAASSVESGDQPLHVASGDLDNAFYRLRPMSGLEDYFTLPTLSSTLAGVTELEGVALPAGTRLAPRLTILPMGWSWAMHFCQAVTMRAISVASFSDSQIVEDGRGYVDNFYVFGHDPRLVTQRRDDVSAILRGWGLTVHEETDASTDAVLVGLELRQGRWLSVKRRNLWRLRAALDTVLRRGCCSSKMLEVLVGHISWACLIRREPLCVLSAVYPHIAAGLPTNSPMRGSVREELWLARSLLPLLQKDLSSPWHDIVGVSDASEFGVGVAARSVQPSVAAKHGRQCERWRYRVHGAERARERVLQPQPLPSSASGTASLPTGLHGLDIVGLESSIRVHPREFMEVPREFFNGARWAPVIASRVVVPDNILALEGDAGILGIKHILRPGTERLCQICPRAFLQFCLVKTISWTSEAGMDPALVTHLNSMYFEGRAPNEGSVLLAALAHHTPALYKRTAQALPRATRCLAGWRRRVPTRMRLPLPRRAALAIAGTMASWGQPRMGLFIMVSFVAYLRPQEAFRLAGRHLVPPVAHLGQAPTPWGLLLHDSDLQLPGKTNLWDESVLLDQAPWLESALEALRIVAGDGPLWDFQPTSVARLFVDACRALGLMHLQPHLYSLRHGGASEDLLSGARTAEQVMRRGRWATMASLRRYGKETRLLREAAKVDPDVLLFGELVEQYFLDVFRGGPSLPLVMDAVPAALRPRLLAGPGAPAAKWARR